MKIYKAFLICSLLFFLTMGISCANDLNESDVLSAPSDSGSFAELQDLIDQSPENSVVNLTMDYSSQDDSFSEGISINKTITINGNNHVINANSKSRIFDVSSSGVVLNNIKFINGKSSAEGGAVFFQHGGQINNCIFENNTAEMGGAVYINNYDQVLGSTYIRNSTFINNSASDDGGAIHQFVNCNVYDSTFIGNHAYYAGAIYQFDNCNVYDSTFILNYASVRPDGTSGGYGGAIYQYGSSVFDSNFVNNFADFSGGAIYQQEGSNIYDSNFEGNIASDGGAVYQWLSSNIYSSNFVNNHAANDGGAVYQELNSNVYDSNFEGNTANHGGAVFQSKGSNVHDSTFDNNYAAQGCDDICDTYNHTDDTQDISISSNESSDSSSGNVQKNTVEVGSDNNTGNPLFLLLLALFIVVTKIKK